MELLRLSRAARRLEVHPVTLRSWADSGKVAVTWVGRERRFSSGDIDALKFPGVKGLERPRLEGLYVRVSHTAGQESSLGAQEAELPATMEVLHPKAQGGREELPEDFTSLVTTFAGRLCGMWSAAARRRLLAESGTSPPGGVR